jgi:hypothetical protein
MAKSDGAAIYDTPIGLIDMDKKKLSRPAGGDGEAQDRTRP